MRAAWKYSSTVTQFLKIGYDFPKFPPQHLLPSRSELEFASRVHNCLVRSGSAQHRPGADSAIRTAALIPLSPHHEETMSENIKYITDSSFDSDVLKSDKPVLVDFWAEWCGPCKMIAPILEEVAKEYDGKIQVAKMDVDANQTVPAKFGIRGIPTLILFKNGVAAAQKVGALGKGQLTSFIDSNI
jgi:thioredoxin 1